MGKIIKDGWQFMRYANAGLIRKVDDCPELKHQLIALSETKSHAQMAQFGLLLAEHILQLSGLPRTPTVEACFAVVSKWLKLEADSKAAREVAGALNDLARTETNSIHTKALRALGQIAATPHVRWHPLVAAEYAVVMINLRYPGDLEQVAAERQRQIELLQAVEA